MTDVRLWRLSLTLIPLALMVAMFSLHEPPGPRQAGLAPDAFEGTTASSLTRELAASSSNPTPGSEADESLASFVLARFQAIEGAEVSEQSFDSEFEGEDVSLRNVIAVLPGESDGQVAVIAGRDVPQGSGEASSIASTATLLEMAESFAGSSHRKTLVFVSTDGASIGALGARTFARDYSDAAFLDSAVVISQPASPDSKPPLVIPWSTGPDSTSAQLVESAVTAVEGETGERAGSQGAFEDISRLAIPSGLGEQAPLVATGLDAVRISSSGELPPTPAEDSLDGVPPADTADVMGRFGRAALALTLAMDAAPSLEHGPDTYLSLGANLLPGWCLGLLALAFLVPVALAAAGGVGRAASRPERALRSLAWVAGRALPLLAALLLAYLLALVGLLPRPAFPFDPGDLPVGTSGKISLLVLAAALGAALFLSRPLRPPPPSAAPVAAPAALLAACAATLAIWLVNPFLALLVAPGLYLWMPVAQGDRFDLHPAAAAALLAAGTLPVLAGVADLAGRFDAGPGVAWDLLEMVVDGQVPFAIAVSFCVLGGSGIALLATRIRASAAPPRITVSGPAQARRWSKPRGSSSAPDESRSEAPEPDETPPITVRRQPDDWSVPTASEARSEGRQTKSS